MAEVAMLEIESPTDAPPARMKSYRACWTAVALLGGLAAVMCVLCFLAWLQSSTAPPSKQFAVEVLPVPAAEAGDHALVLRASVLTKMCVQHQKLKQFLAKLPSQVASAFPSRLNPKQALDHFRNMTATQLRSLMEMTEKIRNEPHIKDLRNRLNTISTKLRDFTVKMMWELHPKHIIIKISDFMTLLGFQNLYLGVILLSIAMEPIRHKIDKGISTIKGYLGGLVSYFVDKCKGI